MPCCAVLWGVVNYDCAQLGGSEASIGKYLVSKAGGWEHLAGEEEGAWWLASLVDWWLGGWVVL